MTHATYAEVQVTSNFSFLHGASHPEELSKTAADLGMRAIGIVDTNTLAGVVRAHSAAKATNIKLLIGTRLRFTDAPDVLCFPQGRRAYGRLATLLTIGKRRAEKGQCTLSFEDLIKYGDGCEVVALTPPRLDETFAAHLQCLKRRFGKSTWLAAYHLYHGDDRERIRCAGALADNLHIPLLATNDVLYHIHERRVLQDVLTCIREDCAIDTAGRRLLANAERHLKDPGEMARLFCDRPDAVLNTLSLTERCDFSLDELRYEYPVEPVPQGRTAQEELNRLTWLGATARYSGDVPSDVRHLLEKELALIAELKYAPYFLTVYDIVRFAEEQGILYQGRGSAANSAVCYCLRITAVDPCHHNLLFERFISTERNEPPDIDVDFEHERREEVIQYIYNKYGRERAGLAATVITYRSRSAIRDVGKALGLSQDTVGVIARTVWGWGGDGVDERSLRAAGLDPSDARLRMAVDLSRELKGFPRHRSQHVGGFVITHGPLHEMVPIENAAMKDRTVIEWDKYDLDTLGVLKIDVLALGMLTCLRKGFDLLRIHKNVGVDMATVPPEDPAVYEMLSRADSIGVFQVESRAQMTMLLRLKPRTFYDLVIQVAIVRPGPIQGNMVHPYLRRRSGAEPVIFPSKELEDVLRKTCGVPLFQEQAMRIAIVAAGFTGTEADRLRRAMATFRRNGTIHAFERKFIDGMIAHNYEKNFAERCFEQIKGFGDYGFPESHAASFALLVYVSAWMKCFHPDVFACAILNSQPMGFYASAQLVRDACEHGVEVRPVDVNHSYWDCTLEPNAADFALRLGFRQIKGCARADADALMSNRCEGYASVSDLWQRSGVRLAALEVLAKGDAFTSLGLSRRSALWQVRGLDISPLPLFKNAVNNTVREPVVNLPAMKLGEHIVEDYTHIGLSVKSHPLALLRSRLAAEKIITSGQLAETSDGARVKVAGLVLVRQRPGTASGVIFATLEDETGVANIVIWPRTFERYRRIVLGSRLLGVQGKVQREGLVIHVVADNLLDLSHHLERLTDLDGQTVQSAARTAAAVKPVSAHYKAMPSGRNFR